MTPDDLRERRTALGLTQAQLADALGVTRVSVMRWETGTAEIGNPTMVGLALEALERREEGSTPSSGNPYDDLGLPNAEERLAEAEAALNAALKHLG